MVSKTFNAGTVNEKTALNGLNLKLNEGDFVTVIGGNGAGKSTMLTPSPASGPWTAARSSSTAWTSPVWASISAPPTLAASFRTP